MIELYVKDFDEWRIAARRLIQNKIKPNDILWISPGESGLFVNPEIQINAIHEVKLNVPKEFITLAQNVACHRDNIKWCLLYRTLWRLLFEEKNLLRIFTDNDIHQLNMMQKAVNRDSHKMKAFVRFRQVEGVENTYVAWHKPAHLVVKKTAPFFQRRFTVMNWSIITPDCSAYWDGESLQFGEGLSKEFAPEKDDMEELWKTFYRNIFNPARIKIKMMKTEMPVKYWHTMPETALIPSMLEEAEERVKKMIALSQGN